jgi:hypothetical protein
MPGEKVSKKGFQIQNCGNAAVRKRKAAADEMKTDAGPQSSDRKNARQALSPAREFPRPVR